MNKQLLNFQNEVLNLAHGIDFSVYPKAIDSLVAFMQANGLIIVGEAMHEIAEAELVDVMLL